MALPLLRTLYARLALGLFLLLLVIGTLFSALSFYSVREYSAAVNQQLNRDLASRLVADRNLVTGDQINHRELERLFDLYMSINPSIEIYLLDLQGRIVSFSANPDKIKRNQVSLQPIQTLLTNPDVYPLPGDDPRSHDRRKVFSVTPVPNADNPTGYLYVVLRGEQYDFAESMVHSNHLLKMAAGALTLSLAVGLLAGLVFFRLLTRRLSRLTARVEGFEAKTNIDLEPQASLLPGERGDDLDYLSLRFDAMAQRIAAQLELLKDKDHQRRQLVAQVSHDLRTPLAAVQGYLETLSLKQDSLDLDQRRRFLAIALGETRRLGQLVDELFELAALDAREKQPNPECFMVAELAHDVVQKHAPGAGQNSVSLSIGTVEPAMVNADIAMTERVLDNLISNAISHSPAGTKVRVSVAADANGVSIHVSDSGSGIDEQALAHIFTPFYQAPGANRSGHAGLGLAIARRMAELQQGHITVHNRPAGGAEFLFWLPLADEKQSTPL
ncbi:sensor histidine kinase [Marinobacter sp. M3C]|jgi:signal transduction histidine kinase|uniref:sensor histidine kinase n=1 Tax=unclassified Marinobacter TaxID=83889 RepID=UPI0020109917|nr:MULTISPECIES: ATP-binding protein [unclassified Marinobacter]MCL1477976.1 sensor histidine kinase [Marinobacter sp.]MCL1480460.1 sensor histidine kinase [Marinobacter sp.]MCL1484610.1 sensor histidine kinase [Marinobacter sp.]MCL1487775.1 sensor histidine kinase [Marinobacter sp.]UQG56335.1 sensor histidine kinase [Marinobacter sp. M4C]